MTRYFGPNAKHGRISCRRHCMVVHAHYPIGETRVEREARALVSQGYTVDVICLRGENEPRREVQEGINIYRLPVRRHTKRRSMVQLGEYLAFFILAFLKLSVLQSRWRYPVVQVHNLPDFLIFAALVPKLFGARLILDLHDLMPEFYASRYDTGMASWPVRVVRWQERLSCRFADHVVTVTELWRLTLIQRGVPADKVSVVMNVAEDSVFHRNGGTIVSEDRMGHLNLIYHGNFHQRYGLDLIIRAVDRVREQIPYIRLTLHGRGPYVESLRQLTDELGLQEHVHFSTNLVPISELPQMICQADIGVVPYRDDVFSDGILPTKLMEYAALGMPVIAARTSAIAHYFDDTMVEFFTPSDIDGLAACIRRLHSNQTRRAQLAEGIVEFTKRYSWAQLGQAYATLVASLGSQ